MRLRVVVPIRIELDEEVDAVTVPGEDGSRGLLPGHVDLVLPLRQGLLGYRRGEEERFVGLDGGLLVKTGADVVVATARATHAAELGQVQRLVREALAERDEHEDRARRALVRLEADVVHGIVALEAEDEHRVRPG